MNIYYMIYGGNITEAAKTNIQIAYDPDVDNDVLRLVNGNTELLLDFNCPEAIEELIKSLTELKNQMLQWNG